MIAQYGKRTLSFFLAIVMILSVLPVQAFAEEEHDHPDEDIVVTSEPTEIPTEAPTDAPTEDPTQSSEVNSEEGSEEDFEEGSEEDSEEDFEEGSEENSEKNSEEDPSEEPAVPGESDALIALRAEIAAYIEKLGITPDMPDVMLLYAYGNHESYEAAQASLTKQDEFIEKGKLLSKEEQKILLAEINTKLCIRYREVAENAYAVALNTDVTLSNVLFSNSEGSMSESNGTITATVAGKAGDDCGNDPASATMTITVTNKSGEAGVVSFNMTQTNVNSIKVGTEDIWGVSSYSKALKADESFIITITTAANSTENKLVLTDIVFTSASQVFAVTVEYPNDRGSVTTSVEGTSEDADGITTITMPEVSPATGVTLTADSSTFLCWVDQDNKFLSKDAVYTVNPSADMTVKAVMTAGNAYFVVNGNVYCEGLDEAVNLAQTASNKTIVLANNATLPAGDYTIPSGMTLLIPYDAANTLCTTVPTSGQNNYKTPSAYRTLTLANGANLTVNGALSVSGTISGKNEYNGQPTGPVGFIKMESGSNITVNSGAFLYVWGYITGEGGITVKSGGTVYENFQLTDWRGGNATTGMVGDKEYRVLPMTSYYVQNVEVPMRMEAGCMENGHMAVVIGDPVGYQAAAVPFIGSSGMFQINSGYIIKDYIESEDRLQFTICGDISMQPMKISMKLSVVGSTTIDSKEYDLPINSNITILVESGTINVTQSISLLPGTRMTVGENAKCILAENSKIYVYDRDEWGGYIGMKNAVVKPLTYAPGRTCAVRTATSLADAEVIINGEVDASLGYLYTTAGGANVYSTGNGIIHVNAAAKTTLYQAIQTSNYISEYVSIPITAAKLKNADGSYRTTDKIASGSVTFRYVDGVWTADCDHPAENRVSSNVAATCTKDGSAAEYCDACGYYLQEPSVIPALGHDDSGAAATCTTDKMCARNCGEVLEARLGHLPGAAATCTTDQVCTREGCPVGILVQHTGHDQTGAAATCTTDKVCPTCGDVLVAKFNHDKGFNSQVVDPTCTDAGYTLYTCKIDGCDYSYQENPVDALDHDYKATVTPPTCVEVGYTTNTCSRCGDSKKVDEVAATGHDYDVLVTDATCTDVGSNQYTCSVCGDTYSEEIPAKGHTEEIVIPAKEATCTEKGNEAKVVCFVCTEVLHEAAEIPALGHTEVTDESVAPTCTEPGKTEGKHCSVCNVTTVAQTVIPALDHPEKEVLPAKAATCTSTGLKGEGLKCNTCGEILVEQEVIEMLVCGSSVEIVKEKPATCTETGVGAGTKCAFCGIAISGMEELPALDHNIVIDAAVAPTCTATGLTEGSHCSRCDDKTVAQEVVPALDHDIVTDAAVAPTCTNTGLTEGSHCTRCDDMTLAQNVVGALGHKHEAIEEVAPDCDDKGYTIYECIRCDDTYNADYVDALDHNIVIDAAVAPTCTATGLTEGSHCSRCDDKTVAQEVIPVLDHTAGESMVENDVKPDCDNAGSYDTVVYCTECNAELSRETTDVDKLGHTEGESVIENNVDPDCTNGGGYDTVVYCTKCDAELSRVHTDLDKLGHTEGESVIENDVKPDCNNAGGYDTVVYCTVCDAELSRVHTDLDKLGHTEGEPKTENNVAPDCTNTGSYDTVVYCTECDAELSRVTTTVEALGHVPNENDFDEVTTPATCTDDGAYVKIIHCDVCGEEAEQQTTVIPALDHSFTKYESNGDATCTEDGTKTAKCDRCEETDTQPDEGSALDHSFTKYESNGDATCTANGTETAKCDRCDVTDTRVDEDSALDHSFTNYESNGDATCTANGTETAKCDRCDVTNTRVDEDSALDHSFTNYESNGDATCTANGTETAKCDRCDVTDTRVDEDSALDHSFTKYESDNNATCTEDGTKTAKCDRCDETDTVADEGSTLDHSFTNYVSDNNATCTEDGTKTAKCDRCDETNTVTDEGSTLGHSFTKYESNGDATCTDNGTETAKCDRCDVTDTRVDEDSALDHSFTNYVSDNNATCTEDGTKTAKCDRCDEMDTVADEGSTLGHSFTNYVSNGDATCTADGTKTAKCDRCDVTDTKTDEGSALDHSFTNYVSNGDATCTADGTKTAKCDRCDATDTKTDEGSAKGHTYENGACTVCGAKDPQFVTDVTVNPSTGNVEITYAAEGQVVTVTNVAPCKVGYLVDGAYVVVEATANADGSYIFEVPEGITDVVLVVKGDVNGDGEVTAADLGRLNAGVLGKISLSEIDSFVAEVNDDSEVSAADLGRLNAVVLGKTTMAW